MDVGHFQTVKPKERITMAGQKLERIYLDIDGTLADLCTSAMLIHGRGDVLEPGAWPKGLYRLEDIVGCTEDAFWDEINKYGHRFWEQLAPYPWMQDLVALARTKAKVVRLLTKPSRSPYSSYGKHCWIHKHFGHRFLDYIMTPHKVDLAQPDRVLVDDHDGTIDQWRSAGGIGILVPQPWNRGSGNINTVIEALARM